MKSICFLIVYAIILNQAITGQSYNIHGTISDENGEFLSGTTIFVEGINYGTVSNSYGHYSLKLSKGTYTIVWSYLGYNSLIQTIDLTEDISMDIKLKKKTYDLSEISVEANKKDVIVPGVEASRLSINEIRSIPAFLSEPDVLRSIQTLPGVLVSNPANVNMSVRGGTYSQNLILLDEAPVFNPSHILGFFSSFNPDAVSTVDFYNSVPARYGKMLSSVVDIRMKEGNRDRFKITGGVGLISSRLMIEGPLSKGKGSFLAAGRYCYAGQILKGASKLLDQLPIARENRLNSQTSLWFYDINVKTNYTINHKNRVFLSGYKGFDHFFFPNFSGDYLLEWGNMNGTLRWNHIFNSSLFVNTSFITSFYNYSYYQLNKGLSYLWDASLGNIELKTEAAYTFSDVFKINLGGSLTGYKINPGNISPRNKNINVKSFSLETKRSIESGLFLETYWEPFSRLIFSGGLRFSTFTNIGPGTVYVFDATTHQLVDSTNYDKHDIVNIFFNINPQASISYSIGKASKLKFSYVNMVQYLHKVSNSTLGMPTDIWFPASNSVLPQTAHQFSFSYKLSLMKGVTINIEPYYKQMYHQIDFQDNADLFVNPYLEAEVCSGTGLSKGLELMAEKTNGILTGRISYTLSKTDFSIHGVNNNIEYPAPYDSRHNLSVFFSYAIKERWKISSSFKYAVGRPVTVPTGMFSYQSATFMTYTGRNEYKIDDFHQLDFSLTFNPKPKGKNFHGCWNLSIMNVYNRKNVFSIISKPAEFERREQAQKMYLYGIFPSISYEFHF